MIILFRLSEKKTCAKGKSEGRAQQTNSSKTAVALCFYCTFSDRKAENQQREKGRSETEKRVAGKIR